MYVPKKPKIVGCRVVRSTPSMTKCNLDQIYVPFNLYFITDGITRFSL